MAFTATSSGTAPPNPAPASAAAALAEIDLTGRMALVLRGGADLAHFDAGWSPAATVAAGMAIYSESLRRAAPAAGEAPERLSLLPACGEKGPETGWIEGEAPG